MIPAAHFDAALPNLVLIIMLYWFLRTYGCFRTTVLRLLWASAWSADLASALTSIRAG
jgi:hypothetical protein